MIMKKHDKVVLKSDVFKAKTPEKVMHTPSKSPISRSPYLSKKQQEKVDANDLFQKVCCPNCRFIFKIIKSAESLITSYSRKKEKQINQASQTQEMIAKDVNELKNLTTELKKRLTPKNESILSKSNHFKSEMSQIVEQQAENQSHKEDSIRFLEVSAPPTKLFPPNKSSNKSTTKLGDRHSSQSSIIEHGRSHDSKDRTQANRQQLKQIISKLYINNKVNEMLIGLYKELPGSIEIPSYHKMLYDQGEAKSGS